MSKDIDTLINVDRLRSRLIKYTTHAFQMLPKIKKPHILDVGCGSGIQTMELARLSNGEIIGIDIDQHQLDKLNKKIQQKGLSNRVKTIRCSMITMDFPDASFDIIWGEGTMSIMGFGRSFKYIGESTTIYRSNWWMRP